MQPRYITVQELFTQQTRYIVPVFQRPYVWKRDTEWEPLWDDIKRLAERVLTGTGGTVSSHFLGTAVLQQVPNATGTLPQREIVDGQQRMTTLQLLLKAAEHALSERRGMAADDEAALHKLDVAARQITPLTENPAYGEAEEQFKVWPTNEDRKPFQGVMTSLPDQPPPQHCGQMGAAYAFFRDHFLDWLAGPDIGPRAQALAAALKDHLRLIVLDLEQQDEPQAIFETLNAHGTPLLPADLIKNWLLWEATRQQADLASLYNRHWREFDRDATFWRERVGTGHASRARVDTFLQNWLTARVLEAVAPKHLYQRFLNYVTGELPEQRGDAVDVDGLMADIAADAQRYRRIVESGTGSRFDVFLGRLRALDMVVFHPLLLTLMGRPGSGSHDLDQAAIVLESFLVRRMVCNDQTRGYGSLALTLLHAVRALDDDAPAAPALAAELAASHGGAHRWPDDGAFSENWRHRKFYGSLRRDRVAMMLRAIEEHYQAELTRHEPVLTFNFGQLQVEHVMPQAWHTNWPLPEQGISAEQRDIALQGIGNLTLVSGPLNKTLSNAAWLPAAPGVLGKLAALGQHSKLELNARLVRDYAEAWTDAAISARALELFEAARRVWPSPAAWRGDATAEPPTVGAVQHGGGGGAGEAV